MDNNATNKKYLFLRWEIWAVLAIIYLIVFFHRMSVGVIRSELTTEFAMTASSFALLGSIYSYVYMFMQIPAGILADTLGARKTVMFGSLLSGIGSIIFAVAPSIAFAYVGRFLVGLGVSVVFIPILSTQSKWFHAREFATMTGLTSFVGNLGSVIAQTPLALLVAAFSWRTTFAGIGFISIILGVVCYLIVRNTPEDAGLPPLTDSIPTKEKINFKKAFLSVLKNKYTWSPTLIFCVVTGSVISFTGTFGYQYFIDLYNIGKIQAGNLNLTSALTLSIGALIIGKLSDKLKKRKPIMIFACVLNFIAWTVLVFLPGQLTIPVLYLVMILLGAASSVIVLCFSVTKEVNSPKYVGISISIINMCGFAAAAIITMIIGALFDKFSSYMGIRDVYNRAFMICFVLSILACIIAFTVKETKANNIFVNKEN